MDKEQTPISKYLASLERRQALLTPSPPPDSAAIIRKINFEDATFLQDQSMLNVSPPPEAPARHANKRRRLSVLGEILEEEENQNKKLSDLERLLQQTQGELIESRAMNTKLEHQINEIRRSQAERVIGYESNQSEMRSKMREATEQAESYKQQLNKLSKKEEELRERLHQQTETHCEKISTLEARLRVLETENLELKGKFESGSLKQSDDMRKLSANLEETEIGAEKWVMECQLLRDQLELRESQLHKYQNELKDAQAIICKYNELKAKYDQPRSPAGQSENLEERMKYFENLYVKQQSENIRLMKKMEKISDENRMLRTTMDKEMLLEEQISTFEEEVKVLRSALDAKAAVEAEKGTLQAEVSAWKTMAFKLDPDCTSPMKFEQYIRSIQNQLLESKHENSTLKHAVTDRERTISINQAETTSLREQIKNLTAERDNISSEMKKMSRRLSLVVKDRDGLKELKESYEQEFEGMLAKPLQERINQLEATVSEYETMIQEDPSTKKSCGECEKRIALISEIRTEVDRLKREKAEAETQLASMSQMSTADDGNTTGVKIVSFGLNPSSLSLEARLRESVKEIEELKAKIKELQEQTVSEPSGSDEKLRELEDRNKTLERKIQIVSEAYDFETQQLQLIVSKLCGFHFTLVREPNVQIRLQSIYSHSPNDEFIFQESPNGDMLLLESPILDNFRDDIERFLLREGSIPGFLASVTITYVQSQSQSAQDTSQLPASQQSVQDADETATASVSAPDPREVQVEVRRQRHAGDDDDDEDEEEENDDEEEEDDLSNQEHDDEGEGEELEEEGGQYEEEEEEYDEDDEHGDEHDEESEDDRDAPPPRPPMRGRPHNPPAPPPGDDSDDSDVIMID